MNEENKSLPTELELDMLFREKIISLLEEFQADYLKNVNFDADEFLVNHLITAIIVLSASCIKGECAEQYAEGLCKFMHRRLITAIELIGNIEKVVDTEHRKHVPPVHSKFDKQ